MILRFIGEERTVRAFIPSLKTRLPRRLRRHPDGSKRTSARAAPTIVFRQRAFERLENRRLLSITINEFPLPSATSPAYITAMTTAPDGSLWFTERGVNQDAPVQPDKIGHFDPTTKLISEVDVNPGFPTGIVADKSGKLWFTDTPNIGELDPNTGAINYFRIPTLGFYLNMIALGPDGALWFTESNPFGKNAQLCEFDPASQTFQEFALPLASGSPYGITKGSDGDMWFTEDGGIIGEINSTTHQISEFQLPASSGGNIPINITSGPDGNLWFTLRTNSDYFGQPYMLPNGMETGVIGEINSQTHAISEFALPTVASAPDGIVAGPGGNLWFTEGAGNQIGRISATTHVIDEFAVTTPTSQPAAIAIGSDGNVYFGESLGNKIGQLVLPTGNGATDTLITSTPNAAMRGATVDITATINPITGSGTPSGTVAFYDDSVQPAELLATELLAPLGTSDQSQAVYATSSLAAGKHSIIAVYSGDNNFDGSQSLALSQVITSEPVNEFTPPDGSFDALVAPDGTLWSTGYNGVGYQMWRFDPTARVWSQFPLAVSLLSDLTSGTFGPDGNLWFTGRYPSQIVKFDTTSHVTATYAVDDWPYGILAARDGQLWFRTSTSIAEINAQTGAISYFSLPVPQTAPDEMAVGSDGNIWFDVIGEGANNLGVEYGLAMINPATHELTQFQIPSPSALIQYALGSSIIAGLDGNLWFTLLGPFDSRHNPTGGVIGRLNIATHFISEFPLPLNGYHPGAITIGLGGKLWFTMLGPPVDQYGNSNIGALGTIDPSTGSITAFTLPGGVVPGNIADDADGNPWIDWGVKSGTETTMYVGQVNTVTGSITQFALRTMAANQYTSWNGVLFAADGDLWCYDGALTDVVPPERLYVRSVYNDVLGRDPDTGGLGYWAQQLDLGVPVSSIAAAIVHSPEYYANFVIKPDYLKLLGRAADDAGVQFWTTQMQNGLTDQGLEAGFVAADEFYKNAGGTDVKWIDAIYQLLLGRAADSSGESYWTGQLASGETRSQVAIGIAGSTENNTQLINDDYFHYLGRAADAGGLAYWLSQFANGSTNEDVIAGFTGAAEYYDEHTK